MLEGRQLLSATNGGQWVNPVRVTYSFMPDGTNVGGDPSTLFQTMRSAGSNATWQQQFQKAAAVWEAVANINLVQVSDDGSPAGTSGNQQGDSRFGDIRIGAVPEQSGTLALAFLPPPINGGTTAGDILFNSSVYWQVNSGYDVETVAIHEIGHALGMDHSQISQAVMYAYYNGIKQSLTSDDIAGIQTVYGGVPGDTSGNTSSSSAIDLSGQINGNGQVVLPSLGSNSATDQDWFKVTVPASTSGSMTITLQSTALSSFSPRINVYNAAMQGLGQAISQYSYGATVSVTINGVSPGQVYYIRTMAANGGPTGVGAYGLQINFGSQSQSPIAPPNTTVASEPSQGSATSADSTDTSTSSGGGLLGGLIGGLLGLVGSVVDGIIHIGSLTGYGEALTASASYLRHHGSHHLQGNHGGHTTPAHVNQHVVINLHGSHHLGNGGHQAPHAVMAAHDHVLHHWSRRHH